MQKISGKPGRKNWTCSDSPKNFDKNVSSKDTRVKIDERKDSDS